MRRRIKGIILVFMIVFCMNDTAAGAVKEIAVLPFSVNAKDGVQALQKNWHETVSGELEKIASIELIDPATVLSVLRGRTVTDEIAVSIGKELSADFVVWGSLTRLGDIISADVRVASRVPGIESRDFFAQGRTDAPLASLMAGLAGDMKSHILSELKIARILIEGNKKIDDMAIVKVLESREGQMISRDKISEDIKNIYELGFFRDVAADVADSDDGMVVTFTVKEVSRIETIEIRGNDDIDEDEVRGVLSLETHQMLNLDAVRIDSESIRTLYREKGYRKATVTYDIRDIDEDRAKLVFMIEENEQLYIKDIGFDGNKVFTDDELRDMMEISEWGIFHFFTDSGLLTEETLRSDIDKLTGFYHNNGYINAQLGEPDIKDDGEWIYITIPVVEGKQFKIGAVEITGDTLEIPRDTLYENLAITEKNYFDRNAIIKDIDYVRRKCNDEGYAYATVTPETVSHEAKQTVDVTYHVEKGDLIYINRITISGNTRTRDKVIRRQLSIVEGDLTNTTRLRSSYSRLSQLRYFDEINFQTEKGPADDLMDITVQLREKATGMFTIGAGYSATDKAVLTGRVAQRNLFGRGQTLNLSAYLGSYTQKYEISYIEPWLFDIPLSCKFNLWNLEKDYDAYDLDTKGTSLTLGYPIWQNTRGYLSYRFAIENVTDVSDTASTYVKDQEGENSSSGVTASLVRNTSNDWMFPSKGSKNSIALEHTGTIFQGDTSFTKYTASSTWYFPLFLDNVFAVRGRIGFVQRNESDEIPIYERFSLGGMNSLRGLREVGPRDENGDVIGGETMLNFNVEYIFPLIADAGMKGVVFFDTGNAWDSGYHVDDMRETAGVGIRWYSPIGPLRLEWGHVLDRKDDESASRWEFTIGMMM